MPKRADGPGRAGRQQAVDSVDLCLQGVPSTIACWLVGDVMIDCGPTSCLDRLLGAIADWRPRALLLTHIHLDHAGAAGTLVRRWPDLTVYVHERGAPHLVSPERLIASATRLYGEAMGELWGAIEPVPVESIRSLTGGETVAGMRVIYTPGHASHHVAFVDESSGAAYVGDATGVRIVPGELLLPHTPPPDIDLDAWGESLDRLCDYRPTSLRLPHFGAVDDAEAHIAEMRERLREKADLARSGTLDEYVATAEGEIATVAPHLRPAYRLCSPSDHAYLGLRRYLERRQEEA